MDHHHHRITAAVAAVLATAVLAPAASAAITPAVTLTQAGTQAGSMSDVTLPALRFTATAGRNAPRLSVLTLSLPHSLSVIRHRHGRRLSVRGVSLRGASVAAITLSHRRLVIRLRGAASRVTVMLRPAALHEGRTLERSARRHRVHRLTLGAQVRDAGRHTTRLKLVITRIRL